MKPGKNPDFFAAVHDIARLVPYGRVTSYGAIARALGVRSASRMVGWAMSASHGAMPPVPAHRVVNSAGLLTGKDHFATPTAMREQLEAEGTLVVDNKVVDFQARFWEPLNELSLD